MTAPAPRSQPDITAVLRDMRTPLAIAAADEIASLKSQVEGLRRRLDQGAFQARQFVRSAKGPRDRGVALAFEQFCLFALSLWRDQMTQPENEDARHFRELMSGPSESYRSETWRSKAMELARKLDAIEPQVEGLRKALTYYADDNYNGFNADGAHARRTLGIPLEDRK